MLEVDIREGHKIKREGPSLPQAHLTGGEGKTPGFKPRGPCDLPNATTMERPCCFSVKNIESKGSQTTRKDNRVSVAMLVDVIVLYPTCTTPA